MSYRSDENKRLYRNSKEGKLGGVCAGLAAYFEADAWLIRIIAVTALIFFGPLIFVVYWIAYFLLDDGPDLYTDSHGKLTDTLSDKQSRKSVLKNCRHRFSQIELRLRRLESYVTSPQFKLRKEIDEL
jgi:phage shock protein C